MTEFKIIWSLPAQIITDKRNRRCWKRKLNEEWTLVCVLCKNKNEKKLDSIEIHRKNTAGEVLVSGELTLLSFTWNMALYEQTFSESIKTRSSITKICSSINVLFAKDKYILHGFLNIGEKHASGLENGESKETCKMNSLKELSNDFERLLDPNESCFTDVTLKCDGASILAHKFILSVRSPVFKVMFATPMKESLENEVEITDIDLSTLQTLMAYIYTGKTPDLSALLAANLMFAAEKYQLQDLKSVCAYFLKNTVSLQNVVKVLVLGDLQCEDLKSFAVNYICKKRDEFSSLEEIEEWKNLLKERPTLALEVLTSLVKL